MGNDCGLLFEWAMGMALLDIEHCNAIDNAQNGYIDADLNVR